MALRLAGFFAVFILLAAGFGFSAAGQPSSAQVVPPNSQATGELSAEAREQWFSVAVAQPGALDIFITADEPLNLHSRLYDTNGSTTLHFDESGAQSSRHLQRLDLNPGTYYFRVVRTAGEGRFTVRAETTPVSTPDDRQPVGSAEAAYAVSIGESATGLLGFYSGGQTDSQVWFRVDTHEPGELTIAVEAEENLKLHSRLYDANGSTTLHFDESGRVSERQLHRADLNPGTYYFRVVRTAGFGRYTVKPSFVVRSRSEDHAPGVGQSNAYPVSLNSEASGLLGFYQGGQTDSQVWFRVETHEPGALTIDITAEENLKLHSRLYDANGSTTLHFDESGRVSERQLHRADLNPGTYYFRVVRTAGFGRYWVRPKLETAASPADLPPVAKEDAHHLEPGIAAAGLMGYYHGGQTDGQSWFQVTLVRPGSLTVLIDADPELQLHARLYDTNGSTTLDFDESGRESIRRLHRGDLNPGTYVFRVVRTAGFGRYTVLPLVTTYPGYTGETAASDAASAPPLRLDESSVGLLGFVGSGPAAANQAWYTLDHSGPGPLLVQVTAPASLSLNARLFTGSTTRTFDEQGTQSTRLLTLDPADPAQYSVRINRTAGFGSFHVLATTRESGWAANPQTFDFGAQPVGSETGAMNFALINLSPNAEAAPRASVKGPQGSSFSIVEDAAAGGRSLPGRSSGTVQVVYRPQTAGLEEAVLEWNTASGPLRVQLTGTGYREEAAVAPVGGAAETPARDQEPADSPPTAAAPEQEPTPVAADEPPATPDKQLPDLDAPLLQPPPRPSLAERMRAAAEAYADNDDAHLLVVRSYPAHGDAGVAMLLPYLSHADRRFRQAALEALEKLAERRGSQRLYPSLAGDDASQALQQFLAAHVGQETTPVWRTIELLTQFGHHPAPSILPQLVPFVELDDYWSGGPQLKEYLALGGADTVAALLAVLTNGTPKQQLGAAQLVTTIRMAHPGLEEALAPLAAAPDPALRRQALLALSYVAPESETTSRLLIGGLRDSESRVVSGAGWGLSRIPHPDPKVLEIIVDAIHTHAGDTFVTNGLVAAASVYRRETLPLAEDWLQRDTPYPQIGARIAGALGPAAASLLPGLLGHYASTERRDEKVEILRAVTAIGDPNGFSLLLTAAEDTSWPIRQEAGSRLIELGERGQLTEDLAAALLALCEDESIGVLETVLDGLHVLGEAGQELTRRYLTSSDEQEQRFGAYMVSHLGHWAGPLLTELDAFIRHLDDAEDRQFGEELLQLAMSLDHLDLPNYPPVEAVDLGALADQDWQLAVLTAFELVRLIMGPMDDQELAALSAQWEPMFRYPSMELLDYLLLLNPVLNEFVMTRTALLETGHRLEAALLDAWTALVVGDELAQRRTEWVIEQQKTALFSLQKALSRLGQELSELLPPPDPAELQARQIRRHNDALLALAGLDMDYLDRRDWTEGRYWVLTAKETRAEEGSTNFFPPPPRNNPATAFQASEGLAAGSELTETETVSGYLRWTPPPRLLPYSGSDWLTLPIDYEMGHESNLTPGRRTTGTAFIVAAPYHDFQGDEPYHFRILGIEDGPYPARNYFRREGGSWPFYQPGAVDLGEYTIVVQAIVPGGIHQTTYTYELMVIDEDTVQDLVEEDHLDALRREGQEEQLIEEYLEAYKEAEQLIHAVTLHTQQAEYFQEQAARIRQDLRTASGDAAGLLSWQLMVTEANRQQELDNLHMAQTGQWVRTTTLYDDYVRARMREQSLAMMEDAATAQQITVGLERLIAMAPPEDQYALQSFVAEHAEITDTAKLRALADTVGHRVLGHWERVGADADEQAAIQEESIFWAQTTKMVAGTVLTAGAAPVAAGLGASARVAAWAPTVVRVAYGGTTGYLEGGSAEAVTQSLAWAHQVGYLATEAYAGYHTVKRDGTQGGWTEAAWRTGQAYVYGKVFEYGVGLASRMLTRVFGTSTLHRPLLGMPQRPSVQNQLDMARYQQDMDQSRSLVRQWQQKQFQLAQAQASGVSGTQLAALQNDVSQLVGSINATYSAKWLLKHQMPAHVQRIYNQQVTQLYQTAMPVYVQQLQAMGYETSNLRWEPVRNAASSGSTGMDFDLRLVEDTPVRIMKNGRQVSRFQLMDDAQKAWNQVYFQQTGYSAVQSDIHITTLVHAEAFSDMRLLQEHIDWTQVRPEHAQQAGDVFRTKALMSQQAHARNSIQQTQAVSRDMEKELRTKVLPFIDSRIQQEAARGSATNVRKLQETKRHWQSIHERVDRMGRQETSPEEIYRMQQELELLTGKKTPDLMDQLAYHFETLGVFYR